MLANVQIVTNYHVIASALAKFGSSPNAPLSSSAPNPAVGKRVALVTLQGPNGLQQTHDAVLVGADRSRGMCQFEGLQELCNSNHQQLL